MKLRPLRFPQEISPGEKTKIHGDISWISIFLWACPRAAAKAMATCDRSLSVGGPGRVRKLLGAEAGG